MSVGHPYCKEPSPSAVAATPTVPKRGGVRHNTLATGRLASQNKDGKSTVAVSGGSLTLTSRPAANFQGKHSPWRVIQHTPGPGLPSINGDCCTGTPVTSADADCKLTRNPTPEPRDSPRPALIGAAIADSVTIPAVVEAKTPGLAAQEHAVSRVGSSVPLPPIVLPALIGVEQQRSHTAAAASEHGTRAPGVGGVVDDVKIQVQPLVDEDEQELYEMRSAGAVHSTRRGNHWVIRMYYPRGFIRTFLDYFIVRSPVRYWEVVVNPIHVEHARASILLRQRTSATFQTLVEGLRMYLSSRNAEIMAPMWETITALAMDAFHYGVERETGALDTMAGGFWDGSYTNHESAKNWGNWRRRPLNFFLMLGLLVTIFGGLGMWPNAVIRIAAYIVVGAGHFSSGFNSFVASFVTSALPYVLLLVLLRIMLLVRRAPSVRPRLIPSIYAAFTKGPPPPLPALSGRMMPPSEPAVELKLVTHVATKSDAISDKRGTPLSLDVGTQTDSRPPSPVPPSAPTATPLTPATALDAKMEHADPLAVAKVSDSFIALAHAMPTPIAVSRPTKNQRLLMEEKVEVGTDRSATGVYDIDFANFVQKNVGTSNLLDYSIFPSHTPPPSFTPGIVMYQAITTNLDPAAAPATAASCKKRKKTHAKKGNGPAPPSYLPYRDMKIAPMFHYGPSFLGLLPAVFDKNPTNEHVALLFRHLQMPPLDDKNKDLWIAVHSLAHSTVMDGVVTDITMTDLQWLTTLPPTKQKPLLAFRNTPREFKDTDYKRQAFTKKEVQVPGFGKDLRDNAPRLIQGLRVPEVRFSFGPFVKNVSNNLADVFTTVQWPNPARIPRCCYTSGGDGVSIGAWYHHFVTQGAVFIENDFGRYDSTQGVGFKHVEDLFFADFRPMPVGTVRALIAQRNTLGQGDYYEYSIPYTRKSGDDNTSVGNTYGNMLIHAYALLTWKNRNPDSAMQWWMLALGDDNLMAITGVDAAAARDIAKWINNCCVEVGLRPTVSIQTFPSYCSALFVPLDLVEDGKTRSTHVLVTNPLRWFSKMGYACTPMRERGGQARLKGNALGMPALAAMPIARVFHSAFTKLRVTAEIEAVGHKAYLPFRKDVQLSTTERTHEWFHGLFGLGTDDVRDVETYLEAYLRATGCAATFWYHPKITSMYRTFHAKRA